MILSYLVPDCQLFRNVDDWTPIINDIDIILFGARLSMVLMIGHRFGFNPILCRILNSLEMLMIGHHFEPQASPEANI